MRQVRMVSRSSRLAERKRERLYAYCALVCSFVFGVISLVAFLSHTADAQISRVVVQGAAYADSVAIQTVVEDFLSGSRAFLFPRTNRFLYPKRSIEATLVHAFPSLERVALDVDATGTLYVSASEYAPHGVWCRSFDPRMNTSVSGCYFIDERARIFTVAPDFSESPYFVYSGGLTISNPIGHQFVSEERFRDIEYLIREFAERGIVAASFSERGDGDYELFLDVGAVILISATASFAETLANLDLLLDDQDISGDAVRFFSGIEYLDLRFGNRIYYKEYSHSVPQQPASRVR